MNQCASKLPLPFALKRVKLWQDKFYLRGPDKQEMLDLIEHGMLTTEREAVDYIDANGEWLE